MASGTDERSRYFSAPPDRKDSIIANFDHSALKRFYTDWYRPSLQALSL
jgi:zinc protease